MLGEVANVVAIIAVAGLGAMMLTGRIDLRRALSVVLGCFVLFGAATIATGIRSAIDVADGGQPEQLAVVPPAQAIPVPQVPVRRTDEDPYAGASVFPHR